MRKQISIALYGASALAGLAAMPQIASAQTAPAAEAAAAGDENGAIIVTARRRDESIVDVPLAISVVSGQQLDKMGITSTNQLANYVPGLQFSDFTPGNSRNDRGAQRPLIFRGLNLSNNGGVTGAGSMFLDGAAVLGNEIPGGMDVGAVEVLRGPQSVYFGRASMTGAVSYRTKAIPKELSGEVSATVAERSTYRIEASIAGQLIDDVLGVRLGALTESNGGYITNDFNNGASPRLGARSRKSASATVEFTPTEKLEIKLYANYFHDEDGMPATVNIFPNTATITNCRQPGASRSTICGEVPGPSNAINYSNTVVPARDAAYIYAVPFLQDEGFKKQVGLQRNALNTHGIINYQISDYLKFQAITGYHTTAIENVGDGIQQPVQAASTYAAYFYNLANKYKDFSQEVRLSSDPERALSWTIGSNYINAKNLNTAVVTFTANNAARTFTPFPQNIGDDKAKTYGFFGGAYLKLFDKKLTLSAEGRYQIDKRQTITSSAAGVFLSAPKANFKSFNPRISADYDVGGGRKVYASYATGSRPGGFNAGLLVYYDPNNPFYANPANPSYATTTQSITNTFGAVQLAYEEEKLQIGELGFKGNFAGGKGYFDLNTYYGILKNQQIRRSLLVPALGFSLGAVTNTGKTELYGVEWSGNYNFTRELSLATTFAWNHTKRKTYIDQSPATIAQYGISDFSGTALPNAPLVTGSAIISYERPISDNWDGFANVAGVYRGKQWADLGNLAYIKGRFTTDVRTGISNKSYKVELFVTNLFNNKTYPGGNVAADFGGNPTGQYYGFYGAYAEPRTVGARFDAKF